MLISDNIVLAFFITWYCVQVCCCGQSIWNFYFEFIRSRNQVTGTNMDDVCSFLMCLGLCFIDFLLLPCAKKMLFPPSIAIVIAILLPVLLTTMMMMMMMMMIAAVALPSISAAISGPCITMNE